MSSQRDRLLEAMVAVAASHGYERATVSRVIEAAGASRSGFYRHFPNREACFLAAYRKIASNARARVREEAARVSASERPRAVLLTVLDGIASCPEAARVLLVEALAASPAIRAEHERLVLNTEAAVEAFLDDPSNRIQAPSGALVSGIASLLSMRVLAGEAAAAPCLLDGLLAWILSYRPGAGHRFDSGDWAALGRGFSRDFAAPAEEGLRPRLLPRGPTALDEAAAAQQRQSRILAATARVVAQKGYGSMAVADIVHEARVTRGVFYSQFRSKRDAFLAAQTLSMQESIAAAAAEFFIDSDWAERVWRSGRAMLGSIADNRDFAFVSLVEPFAAGEAAIWRANDSRMAAAIFLEDAYRSLGDAAPPRLFSETIGGAIFGLMRRKTTEGGAGEMVEVLPAAAYVVLAPFIGSDAALDFVRAKAATAGRPSAGAPGSPPVDRTRSQTGMVADRQ
jgi:AcrR family transcriptional regulator